MQNKIIKYNIKKIIVLLGIFICFGVISQYIIPNAIISQEKARELEDLRKLKQIQDMFQEAMNYKEVQEYVLRILGKDQEINIRLGNSGEFEKEMYTQWFPILCDYIDLDTIECLNSNIARSTGNAQYMVINRDFQVKILVTEYSIAKNKEALKCKYYDEYFEAHAVACSSP